jgi:hypothetical protein
MEQIDDTRWEQSLEQMARRFDYPPTPAIADSLGRRLSTTAGRPTTAAGRGIGGRRSAVGGRLAWALLLLGVAAALLAAPPTRAAILSFFARVGAIDIFIDERALPAPLPTAVPAAPHTVTPVDSVGHSLSLIALGEPTTAAAAAQRLGFAPRVPAALGAPDEVYLHRDVDLPAVTLVWRGPDSAPLSLTQIAVAEFARKMVSEGGVQETTVNGATAMWLPGPHRLLLFGDGPPNAGLIASNVLIWVSDGYTFRLEGDLTLAEARRIAESITPPATPVAD